MEVCPNRVEDAIKVREVLEHVVEHNRIKTLVDGNGIREETSSYVMSFPPGVQGHFFIWLDPRTNKALVVCCREKPAMSAANVQDGTTGAD